MTRALKAVIIKFHARSFHTDLYQQDTFHYNRLILPPNKKIIRLSSAIPRMETLTAQSFMPRSTEIGQSDNSVNVSCCRSDYARNASSQNH